MGKLWTIKIKFYEQVFINFSWYGIFFLFFQFLVYKIQFF